MFGLIDPERRITFMRRALARVCIAIDHTSENGLALRLLELDRPFAIFVAIDGVHQEPFCRNGVLQVEVPASVPPKSLDVFFRSLFTSSPGRCFEF